MVGVRSLSPEGSRPAESSPDRPDNRDRLEVAKFFMEKNSWEKDPHKLSEAVEVFGDRPLTVEEEEEYAEWEKKKEEMRGKVQRLGPLEPMSREAEPEVYVLVDGEKYIPFPDDSFENAGFLYKYSEGEREVRPSPELLAIGRMLLEEAPYILDEAMESLDQVPVDFDTFRKKCNSLGITEAIARKYVREDMPDHLRIYYRNALNRLVYKNIHARVLNKGVEATRDYYENLIQERKRKIEGDKSKYALRLRPLN